MSSRGETSNKEGGDESSLMLQAIQQQFERMNMVFNDIQDRMDRQDVVIASLRDERTQRAPNARRQGRRTLMIPMTTMRMSLKMKRIKFH